MSKAGVRERWQAERKRRGPVSAETSRQICEHLLRSPVFQTAQKVAIYAARPSEPDITPLWEIRPEACYFPRVDPKTSTLEFYRIDTPDDLVPGFGGIPAPSALTTHRATSWGEADLILVPGLVFDAHGGRLGSGLGMYDRFLATCTSAKKWGVCVDWQVAREKLEQEATDVRMGAVVSQSGIKLVI